MLFYQVKRPSELQDNAPWLVLLHGRGADEQDMLALADFFPDHLVVAAPAHPLPPCSGITVQATPGIGILAGPRRNRSISSIRKTGCMT